MRGQESWWAFRPKLLIALLILAAVAGLALKAYVDRVNAPPAVTFLSDALGADSRDVTPRVRDASPASPDSEDGDAAATHAYAALYGVSTSDAARLRADEVAFVGLNDQLFLQYGAESFDLWIDRSSYDVRYTVRAADPRVVRAVRQFSKASGLSIVLIPEQPSSASAAKALSELTDDELRVATGFDQQGTYYDPETSTYVALVLSSEAAASVARGAQADESQLTIPLPSGGREVSPLRLQIIDSPTTATASIYGGTYIENAAGNHACTSGFPAIRSGVKGYYTAAHCFDAGSVWNWWTTTGKPGPAAGSSTYQAMSNRANADIMFMGVTNQSAHTATSRFYGSSSSSTTLMGTGLGSVNGGTECARGEMSGYLCGTITNASYRPPSTICSGLTCNATFVLTNAVGVVGDSGGPVFNGARPMGFITGAAGNLMFYSKYIYRP